MASRSWQCNRWDIAERENENTIWSFWHPKQRDFWRNLSFEKEKENNLLTSYTDKTKSKEKKNGMDGTDIVVQLNDHYTTRSNFCRWVTVVVYVGYKSVWCFENSSNISKAIRRVLNSLIFFLRKDFTHT